MRKNLLFTRLIALLLILTLIVGTFAGCKSKKEEKPTSTPEVTEPDRSDDKPSNQQSTATFTPVALTANEKLQPVSGFTAPKEKTHTILIYMVGSDLESKNALATRDMLEMMERFTSYTQASKDRYPLRLL